MRRCRVRLAHLLAYTLVATSGCGDDDVGTLDASRDAGDATDSGTDAGVDAGTDAGPYVPEPFTPTADTRAYCRGDDDVIEARITDALARLTEAEKIDLLAGSTGPGVDGTWAVPGNAAIGAPGLHMLDGPRGLSRMSEKNGTAFPVAMMRGATWDPDLERRIGIAMAEEMLSAGADVILAPTLNLLRHPRWGRAQETYGEDTHHMGEMAAAFVDGAQSHGVLASAKHFAANSIENTRHTVDVQMDERTLREVYLPHFRTVVTRARVASVMSAYNRVGGLYCDLNAHLLTEILKGEWGFSGFVESDWVLGTHGSSASLLAGLDIEMPVALQYQLLSRGLARGELTMRDIDAAVRRVLRAQWCFGLDTRVRVMDDPSRRETPEHLALAEEAARRGIVLARNETPMGATAPALPLDRSTLGELVVLGRNADVESIGDLGSSAVMPSSVVTALEGLRSAAGATLTVTAIAGTTLSAADEAAISRAGAVLVVTGNVALDEGESDISVGDRLSMELLAEEVALIRRAAVLNPRVIVVLEGGSAITVSNWVDDVEALLFAFYPGQRGGDALAQILFGDAAPSGRLPFSVPVREADLPLFDPVSDTVAYGYLHGYRHLEANATAPTYPFGHGLTYTRFTYANLALVSATLSATDTLEVTVDVTNAGAVRAFDTVQLYIEVPTSVVMRAPMDLRAFATIELAPAETRTVTLRVPAQDLAYWDDAAHAWRVEPTTYTAHVAASAGDIRLSSTFTID